MTVPTRLAEVVSEFAEAPNDLRIELLVDYATSLPALPPHLTADPGALEQVVECQTPFFLASEVDADDRVTVWFSCPPQAPTMRGFAGVLAAGLNGATVDEVLAVPADFYRAMGLGEAISPLRLRGMDAILFRLKRQLEAIRAAGNPAS